MKGTSLEKQRNIYNELGKEFLGCDGGNPNAHVWFCGIEPSKGKYEDIVDDYITKKFYVTVSGSKIPCWNEEFKKYYKQKYLSWTFDQIVAEIMTKLEGQEFELNDCKQDYNKYMNNYIYTYAKDHHHCFKLNLYPLKISGSDPSRWSKDYFEISGCKLKELYWVFCMKNRFPFFKRLMKKYNPKVVVCSGITFRKHFLLAFGDEKNIFVEDSSCYIANEGNTKLIITKFFSRRFFKNRNIDELCNKIRKMLDRTA